ncbi:hypothetical protein BC831DRAFT_456118 [Entophlyctis helioformis]|nr:hypothetical protein BC831DRAFT_456118 [Entophlyctis helioformis]
MAPYVVLDTPFAQTAFGLHIMSYTLCLTLLVYSTAHFVKRPSLHIGYTMAYCCTHLLSISVLSMRCLIEPNTLHPIFTCVGLPQGVCSAIYYLAEIEFASLLSNQKDVRVFRRRAYLIMFFGYLVCWAPYLPVEFVPSYPPAFIPSHASGSSCGSDNPDDQRRYTRISSVLLTALVLYCSVAVVVYAMRIVEGSRSLRLSEIWLMMTVSLSSIQIFITTLLMEYSRRMLLNRRRRSSMDQTPQPANQDQRAMSGRLPFGKLGKFATSKQRETKMRVMESETHDTGGLQPPPQSIYQPDRNRHQPQSTANFSVTRYGPHPTVMIQSTSEL